MSADERMPSKLSSELIARMLARSREIPLPEVETAELLAQGAHAIALWMGLQAGTADVLRQRDAEIARLLAELAAIKGDNSPP